MFDNYRCRICGQVISVERNDKYSFNGYDNCAGLTFSNKRHQRCTLLEDDEKAYCDHISYSMNPLKRAVEVYRIKDGDYELAEDT